jgi:hypothetical protein
MVKRVSYSDQNAVALMKYAKVNIMSLASHYPLGLKRGRVLSHVGLILVNTKPCIRPPNENKNSLKEASLKTSLM